MASLVLGTVGRIFGGPLGGIVGAAVGGLIDTQIFGGGGGEARERGRIGNLAVQSATYGEPIPIITGRMRVAGNLIWTAGIRETATRSGGGKRSGPATTDYSYSASFAVGLAGRRIADIGRIWADGTLIRGPDGAFTTPVTMRLHLGDEDQGPDPLLMAAEAGAVPAYCGLSYAVFEDLPLAAYGNRIPNLTFEIIADAGAVTIGDALRALLIAAGDAAPAVAGAFPAIAGHVATRSGHLADALTPLLAVANASVTIIPALGIATRSGAVADVIAGDCDSAAPHMRNAPERRQRAGAELLPVALELAYFDTDRDYQPGLQRVRRGGQGAIEQRGLAIAMAADQAKTLAANLLAALQSGRQQTRLSLPWRYLGLGPGGLVAIGDGDVRWRVTEARFEGFVVQLDLMRETVGAPLAIAGDSGRALPQVLEPPGPTSLRMLDLPLLTGDAVSAPRLWAVAAGAAPGWRRAGIGLSLDGGVSFASLGHVAEGAVIGRVATALPAGSVAGWDRHNSLIVELLSDRMWLESRPAAAVLAGANLALVGEEILHFQTVEMLSDRRFRLSGLLRGRRGSEAAVVSHAPGEDFVLLDHQTMLAFDPPLDRMGSAGLVRADGAGDADAAAVPFTIAGRALRPLSPVHLRLTMLGGDLHARWIRRSRGGFGWSDFVDAPLGEAEAAWLVAVAVDGRPVREQRVAVEAFVYVAADRVADGAGSQVTISVRQLSASIGPGDAASASITL